MKKRGKFVVVDGLDGVGKGFFINAFTNHALNDGKRIFDLHKFWKENNFHPDINEIDKNFDIVLTSEPTFSGIGKYIREELVFKNGRNYSPEVVAEAYALDRRILYENVVLPLLEKGIDVYQSRSFSTSLIYQRQSASDLGRKFDFQDILSIPGNNFCFQNPMDYLIIPTIIDINIVMDRLDKREKDDKCIFENLPFQLKLKEHYESKEFRELFENNGTKMIYLDAGRSTDFSLQQAKEFYDQYLR